MLSRAVVESLLIITAELFWIASALAQLHKLRRTRDTDGLSAPTATLDAAGNVAWMTYFATRQLWVPVVTNFINLVIAVAILGYLLGSRRQFRAGLLTIVLLGPITSYLLVVYPGISGWVGMIYNTIASTPWLIRVVRTKRVTGISERSIFFTGAATALTLTYAILVHSAPLIVACLQVVTYQVVIVSYYYRYRHRR